MQEFSLPRHGQDDLAQFRARLEELRRELPPVSEGAMLLAHTDGACLSNPDGPGGWAAVIEGEGTCWELWGHLASTSNNRAEILGVLAALEWSPPSYSLRIRSDSQYTLNLLAGKWKAKANLDLWAVVRESVTRRNLRVETEWVQGHAGDPGNERADELSVLGAVNGDLARFKQLRGARAAQEHSSAPVRGLRPRGDWEKTFLASVERQLRAGKPLSEKQQAVVERIRARESSTQHI